MRTIALFALLIGIISISLSSCAQEHKTELVKMIGLEEYNRLMELSLDDFDQSSIGFREHSGNYELVQLLIPEYISTNDLPASYARNLHWHLGQIHGFHENYKAAISEMKQSFEGGSVTWSCYVNGSIAFLEGNKVALEEALELLRQQENQMNIEILENFVKYFDKSYSEAYNMQ